MAGKTTRSTTVVCFVLIVVLSMPAQQVAAISKFCACYKQCFPDCRRRFPRLVCMAWCANDCSPNAASFPGAGGSTAWCKSACGVGIKNFKICGMSAAPAVAAAGEDAACVRDCVKEWKNHGSMV